MSAPKTKTWTVELKKTMVETASIEVTAANVEEAKAIAFERLEEGEDDVDWNMDEDETEITDCY